MTVPELTLVQNTPILEFMKWPSLKQLVLITIGNYCKQIEAIPGYPPEKKEMNRAEVYRHIKKIRQSPGLPFVKRSDKTPYEKMVWTHVDELVGEGFLTKTSSRIEGGKEHYSFEMTDAGNDLFKRVQFSLNLGPDETLALIADPKIRKQVEDKLEDLLKKNFPFSRGLRHKPSNRKKK